jgi:3-oxoacyl-[acyl-carrier protein] reductase
MADKILLVLGASSDVGAELIKQVYDEYDLILAHYCNSNDILDNLRNVLGEKIILMQADFLDDESTEGMINNILSTYKSISHIVHFPAVKAKNVKFKNLKWESYQLNFDVQLKSIYKILNAFLPEMARKEYGKVVLMLSAYTINEPAKYLNDYITVKYALLGFMKALAAEYAQKHININAVSPSMMETKFLENIPQLVVEQNAYNSPMKRNATVHDIVPMVHFLLSDKADYITGQNIVISGGNK